MVSMWHIMLERAGRVLVEAGILLALLVVDDSAGIDANVQPLLVAEHVDLYTQTKGEWYNRVKGCYSTR